MQAIESIASVSEENGAAVEEVSASAEEMSAQVEEVSASAQSLSEMAEALQQMVAQFTLTGAGKSGQEGQSAPAALPRKAIAPNFVARDASGSNGHPAERGVNGRSEDLPVRESS